MFCEWHRILIGYIGENVIRCGWRQVAQLLRGLNAKTEFRFLSEREPSNNSESDIIVTFKTLYLKGHSCSRNTKS